LQKGECPGGMAKEKALPRYDLDFMTIMVAKGVAQLLFARIVLARVWLC